MNPFNKKSYRECYDEYKEELNVLKRNCPKCGKEIAPVNSDANIATEQVSVPDRPALARRLNHFPTICDNCKTTGCGGQANVESLPDGTICNKYVPII